MSTKAPQSVVLATIIGLVAMSTSQPALGQPRRNVQARGVATLREAQQKVVTELFAGDLGRRALYARPGLMKLGATVSGWRIPGILTVRADSWFFFVDDAPGANWEHPAHYVLVNRATGAIRSLPARTPPRQLQSLRALNSAAENQLRIMRLNRSSVLPRMIVRPIRILRKAKYAVLVSGGWNASSNYSRYWNDLAFIYQTLKQKYSYTDDEIIVLYANGTHSPNADLDGDGHDDVDYAATKANLTTVFDRVASFLRSDGKFFFYSTNHGGQGSGANDAILYLWGEWITDAEFATLSKKIVAREAIYTMEQCFSGGMMDNLLQAQTYPCTQPRTCIMTAAKSDEVSWSADTEGDYDEYVYHWTSAVAGKTPTGTAVNADANGDGIVSMAEAHEYAKAHDSRNEHPLIGSCVTDACNSDLMAEVGFAEDCVSFNPATTTAALVGGRWKVVDGNHWLFDFGSNRSAARQTVEVIKHYNMNRSCFVGRPDASFHYMTISGAAPSGAMPGEDCVAFNPATATVANVNGSWKIVDGNHWLFDFGSKKSEADQTLEIIRKYGFTRSCFVARPNPPFTYMRK